MERLVLSMLGDDCVTEGEDSEDVEGRVGEMEDGLGGGGGGAEEGPASEDILVGRTNVADCGKIENRR